MLIGQSPQIMKTKRMIREIAKTNENILLIGEVGSGRKFVAHEIHHRSKQKNRPFIVLNCSAVGDTITEADLFGEKIEGPRVWSGKLAFWNRRDEEYCILRMWMNLNQIFNKNLSIS